eukprot:TRINITY_DN43471_c0_g1_i1.p1 TRINITY_DN43471_c0_g1~~TRINITY_DN43471_c0_g1_i1.p1  ORF type:complete len:457 (+),score=31.40 TRINITY_DN43471_c0_g1_i1:141-1511(+)
MAPHRGSDYATSVRLQPLRQHTCGRSSGFHDTSLLAALRCEAFILAFRVVLLVASFGVTAASVDAPNRGVHLYTFSDTVPHPGLCVLAEAAAEMGGVLRVLGTSKRPGYILIQSHSPTLKFMMLQEVVEYELRVGRVSPDDLMIFVDGHDVFLQRPLTELVKAYERFPGSPYLISGEKNCWPWPHTHPSHGDWDPGMQVDPNRTWSVHRWLRLGAEDFCRVIPREGPYPYPNIGTSMGPVATMLEVLRRNNHLVLEEDMNDQGAMWLVILRHASELNIQIDQFGDVFMNMLQYKPGDLEREPCVPDWFSPAADGEAFNGRDRVPPRNTLTNRTPALLHFNGPSHEDGRWEECFKVYRNEFRRTDVGHALFDVDHNLRLSTDVLCDYSFTSIDNFHALPVNGHMLAIVNELMRLPMDPGLATWLGNGSTINVLRYGNSEDLQKHSGIIQQALQGDFR